jgi:hypothetical protein
MRTTILVLACLIPHLTQVNGITGEPIRRALVSGGGHEPVFTGPDGRFLLENVPKGGWGLSAKRPGFLPFWSDYTEGKSEMRNLLGVTVTLDKNDFELKLYPTPRISGHVTDESKLTR